MKFVLRIMGGLGNQLFQYGLMRYLNLQYPGSKMMIDSRGYKNYKIRDFELKSFKLYDNVEDYNASPLFYTLTRKIYHLYQFLYRKIFGYHAPMFKQSFSDCGLIYATVDFELPKQLNDKEFYFLYGYFSRVDYIEKIRRILINDVQLKDPLSDQAQEYLERIRSVKNSVAVSVRCGKDYKQLGWPICTPAFYRSGMDKIQQEHGECKFFVFSDVIDEIIADRWFEGYDVIYVKSCSVVESFMLLRSCNDFVIANSSFSWWGAWLCENKTKIVYSPNYFFTESYNNKYDKLIVFEQERFLDYKTGEEANNLFN